MIKLTAIAFLLVLFLFKGTVFLDPDFGWHYRLGALIQSQGVYKTDPFSYTMPTFPFVDHEWLSNLILAKLFPLIQMTGLSLLTGLLATGCLLVVLRGKITSLNLPLLLLAAAVLSEFSGVRVQVVGWLLFAVLVLVLHDQEIWRKYAYLLPVVFLLWVNLHGSFAAGLAVLILYQITEVIRQKKSLGISLIVICQSTLATLVNPYGVNIWGEVWQQASDNQLRFRIGEWVPIFHKIDPAIILFVALSLAIIWKRWEKIQIEVKLCYFGLLLAGISSIRHLPFLVLFTLPLLDKQISGLSQDLAKIKRAAKRFDFALKILTISSFILLVLTFLLTLTRFGKYGQTKFYPEGAVNYLRSNLPEGQVFNDYDFGGYLIWALPEKKVFVDGRMPSWRRQKEVAGESNWAFQEYLDIIDGKKNYQDSFKKYQVKTVLLKKTPNDTSFYRFLKRLTGDGWVNVYEDSNSQVYQKL